MTAQRLQRGLTTYPASVINKLAAVANSSVMIRQTPDANKLVAMFLSGRSKRTIEAYSRDLADFSRFLSTSSVQQAAEMLLSHSHGEANALVIDYKAHLQQRTLQSATVNRRLAAIRSLVQLARTLGLVAWELEVQNLKSQSYRDTKGPGLSAYKRLLKQLETHKTKKNVRDFLALRLLYDVALRCSEVCSLNVEDVNLDQSTLQVIGKGQTAKQSVTLPAQTLAALKEWLLVRGTAAGPLFTNYDHAGKGQRLTAVSLYRIVRRLGEKIGVKVRPHGLRHTAITEACKIAAREGIGLEEVLDFSRHSRKSIAVLMVYRDRERNIQGKLASLIANEATPSLASANPDSVSQLHTHR